MVYKEVGGGCAEALVEVEKAEDSDEHLPAKEVASSGAFVSSISSSNSDPVEVSESLITSATMLLL